MSLHNPSPSPSTSLYNICSQSYICNMHRCKLDVRHDQISVLSIYYTQYRKPHMPEAHLSLGIYQTQVCFILVYTQTQVCFICGFQDQLMRALTSKSAVSLSLLFMGLQQLASLTPAALIYLECTHHIIMLWSLKGSECIQIPYNMT